MLKKAILRLLALSTYIAAHSQTLCTSCLSGQIPDGEGVQDVTIDSPINLAANTSYTLSITLINELANSNEAEYNITEEVEEEDDEHMFFFSWTNNVFSDPTGNGNIDNRADNVNCNDEDDNGQSIGQNTSWTAGTASSGKIQSSAETSARTQNSNVSGHYRRN